MKLVGYQKIKSFEKDKDSFTYYKLFYEEDIKDYKTTSSEVVSQGIGAGYISVGESKIPAELSVGCEFKALYNRFGKVEQIQLI